MQREAEALLSKKSGDMIWKDLLKEAEAAGLLKSAKLASFFRFILLFVLFASALGSAWFLEGLVPRVLAYFALSLVLAQFAFLAHDAGHGSLASSRLQNQIFGQASMTLIAGMPFQAWYSVHHAHHQYCQNEELDPDMHVDLFVSLTEESARRKGPVGRFFTRYQGISIWFLSLLFAFSQRHQYQYWVLRNLKKYRWDALFLIAHVMLWFLVPIALFELPWSIAVLAYIAPLFVLGPHLAAIFWINHIGMPIIKEPSRFSFLEHQIRSSRTKLNRRGWNWLFGGLNYQIEHHLLPKAPSYRLARLQTLVSRRLVGTGLTYKTVGWSTAVQEVARHLRHVARVT